MFFWENISFDYKESNEICNDQLLLIFTLELEQFNGKKLFHCEKYNHIRFLIGPSLYGKDIRLKTNYSDNFNQFNREHFTEIDISNCLNTFQLNVCGSFQFICYESNDEEQILGEFYIVVNPQIFNNLIKSKMSINDIRCQTVISKLIGSIDTWKDKLMVTIKSNYNMVHWTPIQKLGGSNSAYSISDQLCLNPKFFSNDSSTYSNKMECVQNIIDWLKNEHNVYSITDIVLNHTANESLWLKDHPEASYNCWNSPWLRPAFLLDRLLWNVTLDIEKGRWNARNISDEITEPQLDLIKDIIINEYLPSIKIEEFYLCDVKKLIENFRILFLDNSFNLLINNTHLKPIELLQDSEYRRLNCSIDFENIFKYLSKKISIDPINYPEKWIELATPILEELLINLNNNKRNLIENYLQYAIDNVIKGARYERFDPNGPKLKKISKKSPLTTQYFTDADNNDDLCQKESSLYDKSKSSFYMAHNGWVMGDDPLKNFAEQNSLVYLKRELICWGDSVKLRYGNNPIDSPYLWSHMEKYVVEMAKMFCGLRFDNCHSTPIHVAQYMLDAARRVKPDLYIIAELFTNNEDIDNIFINKLGINSLIREAMSANTPFDLGRQVYYFGAKPVGSFMGDNLKATNHDQYNLVLRPFNPCLAHAIFFDQTHDNESPIVRRSVYDPLASSALVAMTYSAIGSNRGYDELVPHHIHVVNEKREYRSWNDIGRDGLNESTGIISGKRTLNHLHGLLNEQGFTQAFVDQRDRDTIAVTRYNFENHETIILVARTAFYPPFDNQNYLNPLYIEGKFKKLLFEMKLEGHADENFEQDSKFINGYSTARSIVQMDVDVNDSKFIELKSEINSSTIYFKQFPPSSVIALLFTLNEQQKEASDNIKELKKQFESLDSPISRIINELNLIDLNYILFRCNTEEVDETNGHGVYNVSGRPFVYSGLAGVMFLLAKIRSMNDLGHYLCDHLRKENYLPNYIVDRLKRHKSALQLALWLENIFKSLFMLPRNLIPCYFESILSPLFKLLLDRIWMLQSNFVQNGDEFIKRLTLGGVALIGSHPVSPLPPLSVESIPKNFSSYNFNQLPTMSAGLPHFSSGYMRNWGRDTFISLKGLTLVTGRFDEAKMIILAFGGCLRHGLIPNLLDGGNKSRYNCRDAVWWWLQSIKEYIQLVSDGHLLLKENVRRIYPNDDSPALLNENECINEPLYNTMQETLERHFNGIDFLERNHGKELDEHMTENGFKINIKVDKDTGFVSGGNRWNCGTWMDKMGSSIKAGNKGEPATPRNGSAVEIIGLSYSVISFLADLYDQKIYPFEGVGQKDSNCETISWTYRYWSQKIKDNFEKYFYIDENTTDEFVNRRFIYKDTLGASMKWMDFQLRPNFLIAMVISSDIFDRKHAIKALNIVSDTLVGPLGIKTLDPSDWNYRGYYNNDDNSDDRLVANGFNYHNGPEWLWLMGYYLMARLKFTDSLANEIITVRQILAKHYQHLCQSEWFGLAELTNANGEYCQHSCPIQAWSHGTLLEALYLINCLSRKVIQ